MSKRDVISEILGAKERSGGGASAEAELYNLERIIDFSAHNTSLMTLIPIRLVTILEVFTKSWIKDIIDRDYNYARRAGKLFKDLNIKLDHETIISLTKKDFSFGELISFNTKIGTIESIFNIFSILFDFDLKDVIKNTQIKDFGEKEKIKIEDVDKLFQNLIKLFQLRHIFTHELPSDKLITEDEIRELFSTVKEFIICTDHIFTIQIYGDNPITQQEMNHLIISKFEQREIDLKNIYENAKKVFEYEGWDEEMSSFYLYAENNSRLQASGWRGGTGYNMIYYGAKLHFYDAKIDEIDEFLRPFVD